MSHYGDGSAAPPVVAREYIELQRAAGQLAIFLQENTVDRFHLNVEADISATLLRFVVHYKKAGADQSVQSAAVWNTVEIDLQIGDPIDNHVWLSSLAKVALQWMNQGSSDLLTPNLLNYMRYVDASGKTMFQQGTPVNVVHASTLQKK